MSIVAPGTPAPEFTLKRADESDFTRADLLGSTTVLVFFPKAFSPVCLDQFQAYDAVLDEITGKGATLLGVSCDSVDAQAAFKEKLGVRNEFLSDFHPKGAASQAFGAWFEPAGFSMRALVIVGADGTVSWSYEAASPGDLPPADLILEGLAASQ